MALKWHDLKNQSSCNLREKFLKQNFLDVGPSSMQYAHIHSKRGKQCWKYSWTVNEQETSTLVYNDFTDSLILI